LDGSAIVAQHRGVGELIVSVLFNGNVGPVLPEWWIILHTTILVTRIHTTS
jgi:hypothetical protein